MERGKLEAVRVVRVRIGGYQVDDAMVQVGDREVGSRRPWRGGRGER